jgi:hypothetical protein
MHRTYPRIGISLLTLLCALPLSSRSAAAQNPPPIQGVTGTIATDGTIESEHKAGRAIGEGAAYVGRGIKKLLPFGGKGTNPMDAFTEGSHVVMRDAQDASRTAAERADADGEGRKSATEGVVVDVNRKRQQITVRFADGKTQALRLIDRAAAEQGRRAGDLPPDAATHVVVSLMDQTGAKVDYDFKRVS